MILGFADADTKRLWMTGRSKYLPPDIRTRALDRLTILHAARELNELTTPPGNRLEALSGDLAGMHSIRINKQWRIVFRWTAAGPDTVAIIDYH